jgi:putative hydrolase of the HAD superfamily
MSVDPTSAPRATPRWAEIDTVLLDMDGTLLDLRFDNFFWLELVPQRYAVRHGLTLEQAREVLSPRFAARRGSRRDAARSIGTAPTSGAASCPLISLD